jgi:hypothetical protein
MANRFNVEKLMSLYKGLTLVHARVLLSGTTPVLQKYAFPTLNSGALGSYGTAATSGGGAGGFGDAAGTDGVLTVARTGAGLWTVTLQDNYQRCLLVTGNATLAGGTSNIVAVHQNSTISNLSASSGSIIGVCLESATATAADPDDGSSVDLLFLMQNSTVG